MKKIFLNISLFAFGIGLFASCDSLLDVKPRTAIDASTALTNETALLAALRASYDRLQTTDLYGSSQIAFAEALGDNGRGRLAGGASTNSGRLGAQLQHLNGSHLIGWTQYYLLINQVNLILEATPNVKELSASSRNTIEGQALFLRALAYHDLVKSYAYDPGVEVPANDRGGVPLVLTGVLDASQVTLPSRAPVQAVYDQIYKDLEEATKKLNGITTIQTPAFAGSGAVLALHSRVALFRRDYATAVQKANDALLFAPRIVASTAYKGAWRTSVHPESVFELPFATPENIGVNVSLQSFYTSTVNGQPNTITGGFGDMVINNAYGSTLSSQITTLPSIASGTITRDERFFSGGGNDDMVRLGALGRGNQALQELCKFYGRNGQINLDNIPLIRTPEIILNRAEAQFYLGNENAARTDLATIISNRYTNNGAAATVTVSLTGTALINEILRQRRLELAFEGHRFFDMKRNGESFPRPGGLPTTQYIDTRILAPIPQADLNANPNLVQNAGY
jgi:starch-binding outer membrane protein, SusD/RagB family